MFALIATFSDGHSVKLDERYDAQFRADRAAQNYIRDFSDPCQLGIHVSYVTVVEARHEG